MGSPSQATSTSTRSYRMRERAEAVAGTRAAILDAAVALDDPGATVAEIAARSGVSTRTVIRHFGDRDGLRAAALQEAEDRIRSDRFAAPPGDLEAAVENLVAHYEEMGDRVVRRLALEGTDERIDEILESGRRLHREWVSETLGPLLERLPHRERRRRLAALVAACDVYTWKLLRRDQGLGVAETRRAIEEMIDGITKKGTP